MARPTQAQIDQALAAYRAEETPEAIAELLGLEVAVVETLISEGLPRGRKDAQGKRAPAVESFDVVQQRGMIEILNAEIDWAQINATRAAKTAEIRAETAIAAATIERSLVQVYGAHVREAMKGASPSAPPSLGAMGIGADFARALKAMRTCQDPTVDIRAADIFKFLRADADEDEGVDQWEQRVRELAALSNAEQDEYTRTGVMPKPQLDLPLEKAG